MMRPEEKIARIKEEKGELPITKMCEILDLPRSSFYYKGKKQESPLNVELMNLMDKKYQEHPEYGPLRMHSWLTKDKGYIINEKRIDRLYYKVMGLNSVLPGPHTSRGNKQHKKYPYLLKNMAITRCNQVWMTDITYIPMNTGYTYMMAIIDVFSRTVLHWSISNTMDAQWCCNNLEECIALHGCPEILNTDQGSQFTSDDFVYRVLNNRIKLSMDGKGRATDNIYIERFWRTIKYEHIYVRPSGTMSELITGVKWFIDYYNNERRHESLDYMRPIDIYIKIDLQNAA